MNENNKKYLKHFPLESSLGLPLEKGGKLSKKTCQLRLQEKVQEALDRLDPIERTNFLRKIITEAVVDRGLLDLD